MITPDDCVEVEVDLSHAAAFDATAPTNSFIEALRGAMAWGITGGVIADAGVRGSTLRIAFCPSEDMVAHLIEGMHRNRICDLAVEYGVRDGWTSEENAEGHG